MIELNSYEQLSLKMYDVLGRTIEERFISKVKLS
jgi:hypothetical protein